MNRDQGSLFGTDAYGFATVPASRASDPPSSHAAEQQHTASGARHGNCAVVLAILRRQTEPVTFRQVYAAATDAELDGLGEGGAVEVMRRLNDLREAKMVRNGPSAICPISRKRVQTWEAI